MYESSISAKCSGIMHGTAGIAGQPGCAAAVLRGSFVALAKRVKQQGIQREGAGGSSGTPPVGVGLPGTGSPWKGSGGQLPACGRGATVGPRMPAAALQAQVGAGGSAVLAVQVCSALWSCDAHLQAAPAAAGRCEPIPPPALPLVPFWLLQDLGQVLVFAH